MSLYEDFLKQAPVHYFHCGIDGRPLEMEKSKTLKNAFEAKVDASPERMERIKATLQKSKVGRETLDFLAEKKSKLIFEKMDYYGYFAPDKNLVALNPAHSDEDLAITFVHEMRHARQDSIMPNLSPELTPKSLLVNGYMIEADACATECVLAHEMKEQGDWTIFDAHQKTGYAAMSTAYEKEFDKSQDYDAARGASMLAWYNLRVKDSYAKSYVDFMGEISKDGASVYFMKDFDVKKMAQKLCINSYGECYLANPKLLEEPERLNVSEKQAPKMLQSLKSFMKKNNRSPERLGIDKIYVKHADGKFTTARVELKNMNANNVAKAKGRGSSR